MYKLVFYKTFSGDEPAIEFIAKFNDKVRGKIYKWLQKLEENGPNLPRPFADILRDKIRELRISHGHLHIRLFYFFHGSYIVVTHGMLKKEWKIPPSEIEKAIKYMNEFLNRKG